MSFSPCIYPLIPVTLSIVGAACASSHSRGFFISSIFVLGFCVIYTLLGIIASVFGLFLGRFFINPFTYLILSIIFFLLGFSLFDLFPLRIPVFAPHYTHRRTFFSLFVLGMISGLAVIPCNFPVLGAILSVIAFKKDIIYGGGSLFLFSLGYGLILIILGTFTSLISRLPKQGFWLIIVKKISGLILILMGGYFLLNFIKVIQ